VFEGLDVQSARAWIDIQISDGDHLQWKPVGDDGGAVFDDDIVTYELFRSTQPDLALQAAIAERLAVNGAQE
jgi:hypothetical protein